MNYFSETIDINKIESLEALRAWQFFYHCANNLNDNLVKDAGTDYAEIKKATNRLTNKSEILINYIKGNYNFSLERITPDSLIFGGVELNTEQERVTYQLREPGMYKLFNSLMSRLYDIYYKEIMVFLNKRDNFEHDLIHCFD